LLFGLKKNKSLEFILDKYTLSNECVDFKHKKFVELNNNWINQKW
jgi:hypothetical protein